MKLLHKLALLGAASAVGACSSSTTPTTPPFVPLVTGSATANSNGTYTLTQSGTTVTVAAPASDPNTAALGLEYWHSGFASVTGYVYKGADVTAMAIMNNASTATLAGLSGTAAASLPTSGTAAYTGAFSATYLRGGAVNGPWNVRGVMTTNVDFGAGTLSGTGSDPTSSSGLTVYGAINGTNFNGLAAFSGLDYTGAAGADLSGGFYGSNTLAGIYQNATVTGVIWGAKP